MMKTSGKSAAAPAELLNASQTKFPELTQGRYEEVLKGTILVGGVGIYSAGPEKGKRFLNLSEATFVKVLNDLWPDNKLTVGGPSLPDPRRL